MPRLRSDIRRRLENLHINSLWHRRQIFHRIQTAHSEATQRSLIVSLQLEMISTLRTAFKSNPQMWHSSGVSQLLAWDQALNCPVKDQIKTLSATGLIKSQMESISGLDNLTLTSAQQFSNKKNSSKEIRFTGSNRWWISSWRSRMPISSSRRLSRTSSFSSCGAICSKSGALKVYWPSSL